MIVRQSCENCNALQKSFFDKLDKSDLNTLNLKKNCNLYKKEKTIFCAGTRPSGIYCLNQGKVKIFKYGSFGKEQIIRFVMPGELFGLRALLSDRNYNSTATVLEDSVVCTINKINFFDILNKYPQIATRIMAALSQLLEDADNKITSLAQKPVRERLAESLLILKKTFHGEIDNGYTDHSNLTISLTRKDIANIVGTSTETVIRLLSEFKKDNLITIKGRKITLRDIKGLMRVGNIYE
ncbi:MAG: Crp/Fnr family transcriptional regulator [Bacteroidetes bacterium]|nr:Crp/Fnr family transcriptional regulator [Bacteroidota bacterium]